MIHRDEVPIIPLPPPDGTFIGKMYMMPDFSSWEFSEKSDVENDDYDKLSIPPVHLEYEHDSLAEYEGGIKHFKE